MQRLERLPEAQGGQIAKVHLHKTSLSRLGEVAILSNVQKLTQRVKKGRNKGIYFKQRNR